MASEATIGSAPACGALIGPEGETCGVPRPFCREHRAEHAPRCTVCGAQRIVQNDGRVGACSLVPGRDGKGGCPAPLHDADVEAGRAPRDARWVRLPEPDEVEGRALVQRATPQLVDTAEPDVTERAARFLRERYPHLYDLEGDLADLAEDAERLASLLRALERETLERAERECEAEIASYDSGTHEYFTRGAQGCLERIRALRGGR